MKFPYLPLFFYAADPAPGGAPTPAPTPTPIPDPAPPVPASAPTPAPEPIDPAPAATDPLATMAAAAGMSVEDFKTALANFGKPAPAPAPTPAPIPDPAPVDDANLSDVEKERQRADSEKVRADASEARIQRFEILESCDVEAAALGLAFHPGTLSTLHAAGAFKDVTFADGKPQNVRKALEAIATANPWAIKTPGAVDTDARNAGRGTSLISDDDVEEAARKYGIRR